MSSNRFKNVIFFQSIIFIDMEGTPVQELCAIEVDTSSNAIIDVFHEFANYSLSDQFAREHVHGLNNIFLWWFSVGRESFLLKLFLSWLKPKKYKALYANNPAKEAAVLGLPIQNFPLPNWVERQHKSYHCTALNMKNNCEPVFGTMYCPQFAHCSYVCPPAQNNPQIRLAKAKHGYHCALYDTYELYLAYVSV